MTACTRFSGFTLRRLLLAMGVIFVAMLGFASTVALARYLSRGDVIE